jgi:tight adherence protein B
VGALAGLLLGLGVVLVLSAWTHPQPAHVPPSRHRIEERLAQAGMVGVTPIRLLASCVAIGLVAGLVTLAVSQSWTITTCFAAFASYAPMGLVNWRRRQRQEELRSAWPDAVDNLASGVRAGLSLPEALAQLGVRGPDSLRPAFARFGEDYRASGRFGESLDRLKVTLADPVGDRVVESLRLAREVGGADLGRLLRTLSTFLREDARTRSELEARQTWTVNAARLAVAAPWILLGLLALRPEAVRAYNTPQGFALLAFGAGVCAVAYRLMLRIGRLPTEERVLR